MTLNPNQIRQGDVLLSPVSQVPPGAKIVARDEADRLVIAHGEVTGHAHAFREPHVTGYSTRPDGRIDFIEVGGSGATLRHELISGAKAEHDEIVVAPGIYEAPVQVEHRPKQSPWIVAD